MIRARWSRTLLAVTLLSPLSLASCRFGMRPDRFPPAQGPQGVRVAIRVAGESEDRLGELYAADSIGVTFATSYSSSPVIRVAWARLKAMDLLDLGSSYDVHDGETVDGAKRQRIALTSRFPQGLSGAMLARVLATTGQQAIVEIR